jgi:hypothetical protein
MARGEAEGRPVSSRSAKLEGARAKVEALIDEKFRQLDATEDYSTIYQLVGEIAQLRQGLKAFE